MPAARQLSAFGAALQWRRALTLQRRLLAGELGVIGEVSRNESDTNPALVVLLLGALAASVGAWLWVVIGTQGQEIGGPALRMLLLGTIASLVVWSLWVGLTWHALSSIFLVQVNLQRLVRSMAVVGGFAAWQFFLLAGPASFAVGLLATLASVLLTVLAVQTAAPAADDRAVLISVGIGFGVYALMLSLLANLTGVGVGFFVHALS